MNRKEFIDFSDRIGGTSTPVQRKFLEDDYNERKREWGYTNVFISHDAEYGEWIRVAPWKWGRVHAVESEIEVWVTMETGFIFNALWEIPYRLRMAWRSWRASKG